MRRERMATGFLLLSLSGLIYLLAKILLPYATPIAWAVILAVVSYPGYRFLLRLMPGYPTLAAGITTLTVFGVVVIPTLLLSSVVAREAVLGYHRLADFVQNHGWDLLNDAGQHWLIAPVREWFAERMAGQETDPAAIFLSDARWASDFVAARAATVARNIFSFFIGLGIMTFSLFFALRDGATMLAYAIESLPMERSDRDRVVERLETTVLAVVQGLTITSLVQGTAVGFGLWMVGVPFPLMLGAAAFVLSFLPVGGAAVVWAPAAIGLAITGEYTSAAILAVWGMVLVSSVDNLLRPMVIGSQTELSTPVLFFGILGGLQAFGFIGLFLGPVVLAVFACLLSIYRERFLAGFDPAEVMPSARRDPPAPSSPRRIRRPRLRRRDK